MWCFRCSIRLGFLYSLIEGEEQNREEGEMAQKSWEEGEIGGKIREEGEKEKLGVGRIELDGPGWGNKK